MNAERRIPIVLVVVSLALMLLVPTDGRAQTEPVRLDDVIVTPQSDSVTVFVKTSREAQYKADLVDSPSRHVIDPQDTVYAWRTTPLPADQRPALDLVRRQVRGRREPPPHPGGREQQEHRDRRRRQGEDVDRAAERSVGSRPRHHPGDPQSPKAREGRRDAHRLQRAADQ